MTQSNFFPLLSLKFSLIIVKNRAGQLQPTKGPHNSLKTQLRATHVQTHIKEGGGTEFTRTPLFTNNKLHQKLQLNDKVVGHTKLRKTQRMIGLLCAALKLTSYSF